MSTEVVKSVVHHGGGYRVGR